MKNPTVATVLNLIPGAGHVYLGGEKRVFGILMLVSLAMTIFSGLNPLYFTDEYLNAPINIWDLAALVSWVFLTAGFMYDGYASANKQNKSSKAKK